MAPGARGTARSRQEIVTRSFTLTEVRMTKRTVFWSIVALAAGGLLGYGTATGHLRWTGRAGAAPGNDAAPAPAPVRPPAAGPGSPAATRRIDGNYLPNPSPEFKGTINLNAVDSKPYWP